MFRRRLYATTTALTASTCLLPEALNQGSEGTTRNTIQGQPPVVIDDSKVLLKLFRTNFIRSSSFSHLPKGSSTIVGTAAATTTNTSMRGFSSKNDSVAAAVSSSRGSKSTSPPTVHGVGSPEGLFRHYSEIDDDDGAGGGATTNELDRKKKMAKFDPCPIVLIDCSGSTSSPSTIPQKVLQSTSPQVTANSSTVLAAEQVVVFKMLQDRGVKKCYLQFWNHSLVEFDWQKELKTKSNNYCGGDAVPAVDIETALDNINRTHSSGTTYLAPALGWTVAMQEKIGEDPKRQQQEKKEVQQEQKNDINTTTADPSYPRDVYIVTDGEIFDPNRIQTDMKLLVGQDVNFYLLAVEAHGRSYLTGDCHAGNQLVRSLRDNQQMNCMRSITLFNNHHTSGFTSLLNFRVPDGYIPFDEYVFLPRDLPQVLDLIEKIIINFEKDEMKLLNLSHQLTRTVYYLSKGLIPLAARVISHRFVKLFSQTSVFEQVAASFDSEVSNHVHGRSTTFQGYRKARNALFQRSQMSLFENVLESITTSPDAGSSKGAFLATDFKSAVEGNGGSSAGKLLIATIPVNGKVVSTVQSRIAQLPVPLSDDKNHSSADSTLNDLIIGGNKFRSAGLRFQQHTLPIIGASLDQHLRDPYKPPADETVHQNMRQWVRANYSKMHGLPVSSSRLLYAFLLDMLRVVGSPTATLELKNTYRFVATCMLCPVVFGSTSGRTVRDEMMDGIRVRGARQLREVAHLLEAKRYKSLASGQTNKSEVFPFISAGLLWYACLVAYGDKELLQAQEPVYGADVNLALLLGNPSLFEKSGTSTSPLLQIAGIVDHTIILPKVYRTEPHEVYPGVACPATESNQPGVCSICGTKVNTTLIESNSSSNSSNSLTSSASALTRYPLYADDGLERVVLRDKEPLNAPLISMNRISWPKGSTFIEKTPIIKDPLNHASLKVKSVEEFKREAERRYPFLQDVDLTGGVALAGGFVRSILLGTKMKDFDFFFYGSEDPYPRMVKLLEQLIPALKQHAEPEHLQGKTKFLYMYKPKFNVFEIIHVADPTDHFNEGFLYDNFKKYKYKTMRHYHLGGKASQDQHYFEDGDEKGIRILNRYQFVMGSNHSIEDLFKTFDLAPACVAYTGDDVLFTPSSVTSYKYMVNVVRPTEGVNELFEHRIGKYFTYGFDIGFPFPGGIEELNKKLAHRASVQAGRSLLLRRSSNFSQQQQLSFKIVSIDDNKIYIEHDSHRDSVNENQERLEAAQQQGGSGAAALYKSTLFPNLVGVMRYMCIHEINYLFSSDLVLPDLITREFPFTTSQLPTLEEERSELGDSHGSGSGDHDDQEEEGYFKRKYFDLLKRVQAKDADENKKQASTSSAAAGFSRGPCKLEFQKQVHLPDTDQHPWFSSMEGKN